ncbi:MAG: hypothetical protein RIB60_09685 [Phycisphaerales bacterium]
MTNEPTELELYLAERDVPCPGCGYNLRGLTEAACPECARAVDVSELEYPSSRAVSIRAGLIAGGVGYALWAANLAWYADRAIEMQPAWISLAIALIGIASAFVVPANLRMQRGSEPGLRVGQTIAAIYVGPALFFGCYGAVGLTIALCEAVLG